MTGSKRDMGSDLAKVDGFRSGGPGWQTRINAALEQWLDSQSSER